MTGLLAMSVLLASVGHRVAANGAEVMVIERAALPQARFQIALRAGSLDDPGGKEGVAAVAAHALAAMLDRELESADIEVRIGQRAVIFSGVARPEGLAASVRTAIDTLAGAPLSSADTGKALRSAATAKRTLSPLYVAHAAARHALWGRHPIVRDPHSVSGSIGVKDVRQWRTQNVRGPELVIAVVAPADLELFDKLLDAVSSLSSDTGPTSSLSPPPAPRGRQVIIVDRPAQSRSSVLVARARPAVPYAHRAATQIAIIFFANMLDDALGADVHATALATAVGTQRRHWVFGIHVDCKTDQIEATLQSALQKTEALDPSRIDDTDIVAAQRIAVTAVNVGLSSGRGRLEAVVRERLLGGRPPQEAIDLPTRLEAVEANQVRDALEKLIADPTLRIVVLSNATPTLSKSLSRLPEINAVQVWTLDALL